MKVVSDWFNVRERGAPTGAFLASTTIGSMIAPPVLTALMRGFGWRGMFMIMGATGLVLALIWFWLYRIAAACGSCPMTLLTSTSTRKGPGRRS